jgi:hypothetical protein
MSPTTAPRRLASVREMRRIYPLAFRTEAVLRNLLTKDPELARVCVRRLGTRLLIDLDAFERWLDQQGADGAVEEGR